MKKYLPLDLSSVTTYPITTRNNKVNVLDHFALIPQAGGSFSSFYDSPPRLLGANSLRGVVDAVVAARLDGRPVVLASVDTS